MSTGPATLDALPTLVAHVLGEVAGLRARPEGRAGAAIEAPLPFNDRALDDANALWAALTDTIRFLGFAGRLPGWRNEAGEIVGFEHGIAIAQAVADVRHLVKWLGYWHADEDGLPIHAALRDIAPRWPLRDRTRISQTAICPLDRGPLAVKPPRWHGDGEIATCTTCGTTFDEAEHALTALQLEAVKARERVALRAQRAAAHLAAKYGRVA